MTSLIPHIEYLLQRHDCVILPGIGAFVVEHVSARIIPEEGVILPPRREISLNGLISHDDGMLATSLSRAEGINFEEARNLMNREIASIRRALEADGEYAIGRIGTLRAGDEDTVDFIPFRSAERDMADMGLTSAPLRSPAEAEEDTEEIELTAAERAAETYAPVRRFSDKNYYIPVNKVFAKCAASVIAVLCVAMALIIPVNDRKATMPVRASMSPIESISTLSADTEADDVIADAKPEAVTAPVAETVATPESDYYLIVATFHTESEAAKFVEMRAGGSYDLTVLKGKNVWRVSAGRGEKSTLQALLNSAEFRAAFHEAWIWNAR